MNKPTSENGLFNTGKYAYLDANMCVRTLIIARILREAGFPCERLQMYLTIQFIWCISRIYAGTHLSLKVIDIFLSGVQQFNDLKYQ